jgi:hypothetical protein
MGHADPAVWQGGARERSLMTSSTCGQLPVDSGLSWVDAIQSCLVGVWPVLGNAC